MKTGIPARLLKTVRTMYLYSDGHAVLVHQKRDKDAGYVDWVTIHESIGVRVRFSTGRLLVSDAAAVAMVLAADAIDARDGDVKRGSDNTKKRGISVAYVSFNFGHGWTYFNQFPDLICDDFRYQPDTSETWAECDARQRWADYRIGERFPSAAAESAAA